jgi:AraC-like DNA-binding protein
MRIIQVATPRRELREFVRVFAQRNISCAGEGLKQPDVASLEHLLAFEFGDPTRTDYTNGESKFLPRIHVVGSQTSHSGCAYFPGRHDGFGIFLKPLASWQLFCIPPAVFANENGDGRDLIDSGLQTLWARLAQSSTFQQRVHVAEEYLLPLAANALPANLVMKAAQTIYRRNGAVRIDELASHSGLSLRQFERRFVTDIGFTPKLFAKITRFQTALDTKRMSPERSWMSVAYQLGYFDQMHMIRDFQSLSGSTPSDVLQQSGDYQPWSLALPMVPCHLPYPYSGPGKQALREQSHS